MGQIKRRFMKLGCKGFVALQQEVRVQGGFRTYLLEHPGPEKVLRLQIDLVGEILWREGVYPLKAL